MRREYINHGFSPDFIINLNAQGLFPSHESAPAFTSFCDQNPLPDLYQSLEQVRKKRDWQLCCIGRMEPLKGEVMFLRALPTVASALDKPLSVVFAGDGRDRAFLEKEAACLKHRNIRSIKFTGWIGTDAVRALLESSDLLVMPSLWPEPFGLTGVEMGSKAIPAVAFDVGGISQWLKEGVNGYLARGDPPSEEGLAKAIVRCLSDPVGYVGLLRGASEVGAQFQLQQHIDIFLNVVGRVLGAKHLESAHRTP
jgi:glycosyltransferase involved in cell wall biosynthesis